MKRMMTAALLVCLAAPAAGVAQTIAVGEPYNGEISKPLSKKAKDLPGVVPGSFSQPHFVKAVSIDLKMKQPVAVTVILTGDGRRAGLSLVDASGTLVKSSMLAKKGGGGGLEEKTARLEIKEAPATGTYTIYVVSNQAGAFELFVKDLSKKRDATAVQADLDAALKRVEDLRKELKDYEKKE